MTDYESVFILFVRVYPGFVILIYRAGVIRFG